MMKSIVEEKLVSFKSLERKVFAYVCELGREITRIMLEIMMRNWQGDGINGSTGIKENEPLRSRPFTEK